MYMISPIVQSVLTLYSSTLDLGIYVYKTQQHIGIIYGCKQIHLQTLHHHNLTVTLLPWINYFLTTRETKKPQWQGRILYVENMEIKLCVMYVRLEY